MAKAAILLLLLIGTSSAYELSALGEFVHEFSCIFEWLWSGQESKRTFRAASRIEAIKTLDTLDPAEKINSNGYVRKITNKEHKTNVDNYINNGEWHCGSGDGVESFAKKLNFCWKNHYEVNMCCAVHDDCYSYGIKGNQTKCDQHFCTCLSKSIVNAGSDCTSLKFWTSGACSTVSFAGCGFYGKAPKKVVKTIKSNIPALNKTVETEYKKLYETCADMNTTLSTCAYNHMLCYMRLQNDKISQNYEDCVDSLIVCLDESISFLSTKNEKCLAQLDVTIDSIADNSKVSGIPVIREAIKSNRVYKHINVADEVYDV